MAQLVRGVFDWSVLVRSREAMRESQVLAPGLVAGVTHVCMNDQG